MSRRVKLPAVPPSAVNSDRSLFDYSIKRILEQLPDPGTGAGAGTGREGTCNYGSFISMQSQTAPATNTPVAMELDRAETARGVRLGGTPQTRLVAESAGVYDFSFSVQLASSSASLHSIYIWPRINGQDVPNSASRVTIQGAQAKRIPAWNFVFELGVRDYFELMWAVDSLDVTIESVPPTGFSPAIPSVILTVAQVGRSG